MDKSECIKFLVTYSRHLSATSHLDLIPLLPQHIQVCTYCCLPTQQQPRQLSCTSETTQPFTKHRTPEALFNATATVLHAPTYETGLPLTYSLSSAKEDLLLTTLPATLKTLAVYGIQCEPYQMIYRRMKVTTQRSPQQTPQTRQLTSSPRYQKISSLIITPLMTSQSFH